MTRKNPQSLGHPLLPRTDTCHVTILSRARRQIRQSHHVLLINQTKTRLGFLTVESNWVRQESTTYYLHVSSKFFQHLFVIRRRPKKFCKTTQEKTCLLFAIHDIVQKTIKNGRRLYMAVRFEQKHIDDKNISKNIMSKFKITKSHRKSTNAVKKCESRKQTTYASRERENADIILSIRRV